MELLMKNYITHVAVNKVPPIRFAASKVDCSSYMQSFVRLSFWSNFKYSSASNKSFVMFWFTLLLTGLVEGL